MSHPATAPAVNDGRTRIVHLDPEATTNGVHIQLHAGLHNLTRHAFDDIVARYDLASAVRVYDADTDQPFWAVARSIGGVLYQYFTTEPPAGHTPGDLA